MRSRLVLAVLLFPLAASAHRGGSRPPPTPAPYAGPVVIPICRDADHDHFRVVKDWAPAGCDPTLLGYPPVPDSIPGTLCVDGGAFDCRRGEQFVALNSVGPEGPQGPPGPRGMTGPQGAQGPKGEKGDKGDQGVAGAKGDAGPTGATGATGATGPQGPRGEPGPAGGTADAALLSAKPLPGPGFLRVQGLRGSSADRDHRDGSDLTGLTFSLEGEPFASGGGGSPPRSAAVVVSKPTDGMSRDLLGAVVSGRVFPEVEIQVCTRVGRNVRICELELLLRDAQVFSISPGATSETLAFSYERARVRFTPQDRQGNVGPPIMVDLDFTAPPATFAGMTTSTPDSSFGGVLAGFVSFLGLRGSSADPRHRDFSDLDQSQLFTLVRRNGVTELVGGVRLLKPTDTATPGLLDTLARGRRVRDASLEVCRAADTRACLVKLELSDVAVRTYSTEPGSDALHDALQLDAAGLRLTLGYLDNRGNVITLPVFVWPPP